MARNFGSEFCIDPRQIDKDTTSYSGFVPSTIERNHWPVDSGQLTRRQTSRPLHHRRHRGQDRLDISTGAQAEYSAAVIKQIVFDITATTGELLLALGLAPGRGEILAHHAGIDA